MSLVAAIAGPLVGLVGVIVAIVIYRKSRERRQLAYVISVTPPLLSVSRAIRGDVEVTYQGRPVTDLEGVTVKLVSTGTRSVQIPRPSEYEAPVTIDFGNEAEILGEPRLTEAEPENLAPTLHVDSGKVVVEGVLLNPRQSISIFTLLSGLKDGVQVSAHLEDVELVAQKESVPVPRLIWYLLVVTLVGGSGLILLGFLGFTVSLFRDLIPLFFGLGLGFLISAIAVLMSIWMVGSALRDTR